MHGRTCLCIMQESQEMLSLKRDESATVQITMEGSRIVQKAHDPK